MASDLISETGNRKSEIQRIDILSMFVKNVQNYYYTIDSVTYFSDQNTKKSPISQQTVTTAPLGLIGYIFRKSEVKWWLNVST